MLTTELAVIIAVIAVPVIAFCTQFGPEIEAHYVQKCAQKVIELQEGGGS